MSRSKTVWVVASLLSSILALPAPAQGPGRGRGGPGHDPRHAADRDGFHRLLTNHQKITRHVTELPNGVETLTESADPEIASQLQEHVEWMKVRIEQTNPIRMRDPLFREIFQHSDKIDIEHEETERGVRVKETSDDPYVVKLIQAHAKVVSGFVEHGFAEAMKTHPIPAQEPRAKAPRAKAPRAKAPWEMSNPKIARHGAVVRLPDAAQQPRDGTKLCVDVTGDGEPAELHPAIEKLARYVNIFAGAGQKPVEAHIVVVLHGDATLSVLQPDAYSAKFSTPGNPNLELLQELHQQGVAFYVCGQSLIGKGSQPDEVIPFVKVAVSALTAVVNQQMDGYSVVKLQ